jgi:hypothetical protein
MTSGEWQVISKFRGRKKLGKHTAPEDTKDGRHNRGRARLPAVPKRHRRVWALAPEVSFPQRHRNLLHNLNLESLKRNNSPGMIREQPYSPQIQVRQNLRSKSNFPLGLALTLRQSGRRSLSVKRNCRLVADLLRRESLGRLMQVNQRPAAFTRDCFK